MFWDVGVIRAVIMISRAQLAIRLYSLKSVECVNSAKLVNSLKCLSMIGFDLH